MSSRALRKLGSDNLNDSLKSLIGEEDEEPEPVNRAFNAFDVLNEENSSSNDEDSGNSATELENKRSVTNVAESAEYKSNDVTRNDVKSKKKKNKKKKSKKGPKKITSDDELDLILEEAKRKDDISLKKEQNEKSNHGILSEYNFESEYEIDDGIIEEYDSNFKFFTTNLFKMSQDLLSVKNCKYLDPDNELRNLFGDIPDSTVNEANHTTSMAITPELLQQFRKLAKLTRGWAGKDRKSIPGTSRKLLLSKIRDDWLPTTQKPLSMEELSEDQILECLLYKEEDVDRIDLESKIGNEITAGVKYFRFNKIMTPQERVACTRFYAAVVMTPDPDSLMKLLQQAPYHAETLLQVAMILLRQGDQKAISYALIERCLFVFDRSFHKRFHELLSQGKNCFIRLPYESFMNRQFYLLLFRYIVGLGERSTFCTALNYSKLLLSFSPAEDPLGVRYFIDFYAIMAEEYDFLIGLSDSPLATRYARWLTPGIAFSSALACYLKGDMIKAKKKLRYASMRHPFVAFNLLDAVGRSPSGVSLSDIDATDETKLSAETYLIRADSMWNTSEKKEFLSEELLAFFEENEPQKKGYSITKYIGSFFSGKEEKKKDIPYNLLRYSILSGENKIMAKIPQQIWRRNDLFEYDVLPPTDTNVDGEFSGFSKAPAVTDSLLSYVDTNILASIIQNSTEETEFEELIRQLDLNQDDEEN